MKVNQEVIKSVPISLLQNLKEPLSPQIKSLNNILMEKDLKNTNIYDGLKTILSELFESQKSDKILLNTLKQSSIFKTFEYFGKETKKLIDLIESRNFKNFDFSPFKSFFLDIEKCDEKQLKHLIEKSIFSSEIKNLLDTLLEHDDKEIQKQASKIITQIEYFQLSSYLNNSIYTYLPFEWDSLEGGEIEFKKEKNKQYTCHIHLELKEYGKVTINLLYEDTKSDLSIGFFLENIELKERMSHQLQFLRKSLKEVGIHIQNISLIDMKDNNVDERLDLFTQRDNTCIIGLDIIV